MQKLSFALGILILPSAFHSVRAQAAETKAGTAAISGRVTLKSEPARGVMVILQTQNQNASNAPRARTDESGRFHFTGLPAGRYAVSALAPGYASAEDNNSPNMRGKTFNLTDGEKVENVDLEIKRGGVIAGRVSDSQGRPVIEERLNLSKLDANNLPRSVFNFGQNFDMCQTDDRGLYRIYGLPEGRYLVSVGYAGNFSSASITSRREFYPLVFYPNATNDSEAKVIEVSEGSEATNIDITVTDPKQTRDVYGHVVDADSGQPVAGVDVVVGAVTRDGRYAGGYTGSGARSGPNGEFRMFGVLPGKYAILARPDDPSGGGFISDPVIVDIGEDTVTGVEVRVRQGASISGVVVIEGTNDPKIQAKLSQVRLSAFVRPTGQGPSVPSRGFGRVNADGSFRLSGLQSGKAAIFTVSDTRDLVLARIERNGAPAPEGIEVDAGEQVTGVRVVLVYSTLAIRGEFRIVGGALPAGYKFFASARRVDQPAQNQPGAEIDARGQFVIENLPPGEYEIRVEPMFNPDGQQLSPEIRRLISSVKERVVLSGGNQQSITLVIDLSRKGGDRRGDKERSGSTWPLVSFSICPSVSPPSRCSSL
jgi:protocatechuate 3,4-dioxygenase beta subunit